MGCSAAFELKHLIRPDYNVQHSQLHVKVETTIAAQKTCVTDGHRHFSDFTFSVFYSFPFEQVLAAELLINLLVCFRRDKQHNQTHISVEVIEALLCSQHLPVHTDLCHKPFVKAMISCQLADNGQTLGMNL